MINKSILKQCCKDDITDDELYKTYSIFFGTLVSGSRLRIINMLRKKDMNVSDIVSKLGADQTSVSHDLARLKMCGFVNVFIDGKYRVYSLNTETIKPLIELIERHMSKYCVHILRGEKHEQ